MDSHLRSKLVYEFLWLIGLLLISAMVEYIIILLFDLHPILSVKVQGIIGLTIIAYGIRMVARLGSQFDLFSNSDSKEENKTEQHPE